MIGGPLLARVNHFGVCLLRCLHLLNGVSIEKLRRKLFELQPDEKYVVSVLEVVDDRCLFSMPQCVGCDGSTVDMSRTLSSIDLDHARAVTCGKNH